MKSLPKEFLDGINDDLKYSTVAGTVNKATTAVAYLRRRV